MDADTRWDEGTRASEARHGARLARQPYARGWKAGPNGNDALSHAARLLAEGRHTDGGMIYRVTAEAMMSWPIYRAAMRPRAVDRNGDSRYYWMDLDFEVNRPDLEASIEAGEIRCIVDAEDGIIGYALGEPYADAIVAALGGEA